MTHWRARQQELAAQLGDQLPAAWRAAYRATPRHLFVPDRVWTDLATPVDRAADPDGWWTLVYSDEAVITQLHDGIGADTDYPISSSTSQPSVVFEMLNLLDVGAGMRVLEAGTGTGWTAALLASRLGDEQVVTVEYDPALADTARAALARTGHPGVPVVVGDGAAGWPPGAPYDRIVSTYAVDVVPHTWVEQARPGAVIVTPWGPAYDNSGLLRLTVSDDGTTATGRIAGWATFMIRRQQRITVADHPDDDHDTATAPIPDDVDLVELLTDDGARMGMGLRLPATRRWVDLTDDGWFHTLHLAAPDAWATVTTDGARQGGARRLWDEAVAAYRWWRDAGKPTRDGYEITVATTGQTVAIAENPMCTQDEAQCQR